MNTSTILLVEDDPDIQFLYASKLRLKGHRVTTANNGKDALEKLKSASTSLEVVLIDLLMPVMGGLELIREIRQNERLGGLPIVVLTNLSKSEAPMGLRYLNIHSYVLKAHTTPTQLADIVTQIIS